MISNEKLREIIYEVNKMVETDPKIIRQVKELGRELSTITREDLDKKMMSEWKDWKPDESKWRVVCQLCGKTGIIDYDKAHSHWFLHYFELSPPEGLDYSLEVEYHLCRGCECDVYPEEAY